MMCEKRVLFYKLILNIFIISINNTLQHYYYYYYLFIYLGMYSLFKKLNDFNYLSLYILRVKV